MRCQAPSAWQKEWMRSPTPAAKPAVGMNTVPDVPRLMFIVPAPTAPVPTAAAALSPAPAATTTPLGSPSSSATSGRSAPMGS